MRIIGLDIHRAFAERTNSASRRSAIAVMKFRPTKLTVDDGQAVRGEQHPRSAAKSHFAFQPASEFAKTATACASRVAMTLEGGGFSGSILTSLKLVAMRIQRRSAPRFGDQVPLSVRSQPQR